VCGVLHACGGIAGSGRAVLGDQRVLLTIFSRHGVEAWRTMLNEVNVDRLRDHFIICGYGQVGRTVVDQLQRLEIPFVLIETNEGFVSRTAQ